MMKFLMMMMPFICSETKTIAVILARRARDQHVRGDNLHQPACQECAAGGHDEHAYGAHRQRRRQCG